ncbi:unnamed protein product [Phaedon cochleariae]|uniref:Ig-like domain-containing protein n=1 Tax=Phaedon cochleariae TaxID=80249 RepID=A0A9P0D886_PHACE|nr:unnamed protein product [Phaedon cochleariae]
MIDCTSKMETNVSLTFFLIVVFSILDVEALKNMFIRVPEAVRIGDSVTLVCDYDLETAALYTIKWYRNDEEFYRFVPKESPPSQMFDVAHLNVDISKSNTREVTLTNVEKETSGEFKCEVTADAPLFHTDIRTARLLVAEIPEDGPVLKVEVQKITPGSYLRANCTTPGSHPAMNVTWYINDVQVGSDLEVHIQKTVIRFEALAGLETVVSTISTRANPDLFKSGKLKLRCSATMFTLYTSSRETEIQEDAPKLALIMIQDAQASEGSSTKSKYIHVFLSLLTSLLPTFFQ